MVLSVSMRSSVQDIRVFPQAVPVAGDGGSVYPHPG